MKFLSLVTLTALLSVSSCSHFRKSCCEAKNQTTCSKENCDKPCCDKEQKCKDGSCEKPKSADCAGDSCHKKPKS